MRSLLLSIAIATALLCSTVTAAPPKSASAPESWSCSFAIYNNPEECRPPRPMKFDLESTMSLGTHVTPGDKGCVSNKDRPRYYPSMAPITCSDERGFVYTASDDGIIGEISLNSGASDDAGFMEMRLALDRKYGPPTLVMRPLRDAKWESTDGAMLDVIRDDNGNTKIIVSSSQGRADAARRYQLGYEKLHRDY